MRRNPYPHEECHSTRRAGTCVGVTKFWVCDQVIDWLKEDGNLGPTELRKKLKETHKVDVTYRKVYLGKLLAQSRTWLLMHPPLLKSTAGGRRKNRMKSALEGGSTSKKRKKCPICHDFGHHWYKCKNGNPEDIAAMEAVR